MSTLRTNAILDASGGTTATVNGYTPSLSNMAGRNLIINGAMQVAQRGTSVSNNAGGYTTVDRFFQTGTLGGTFAWEKSSDAPTGFSSSFKCSAPTGFPSLTSSSSARIGTAFEGQDLQQLLKGTSGATDLTLSFWVKATVTGTYIVELYDTDNTRNICQSYTISASNTWQNVVMTFAGDTSGALDNDNAASLVAHWWLGAGSNFTSGTLPTSWQTAVTANRAVGQVNSMASNGNAFYLTGVQLEVGDTATPFEHRSYGQELALCQRYYWRLSADDSVDVQNYFGVAVGDGTNAYCPIQFPVQMRTTPTLVPSNGTDHYRTIGNQATNFSSISSASYASAKNTTLLCSVSVAVGQSVVIRCRVTGAFVAFDAEL